MLRINLDLFIGVLRLPSGNSNESWHKTDCCNVLSSRWFPAAAVPPNACGLSISQLESFQSYNMFIYFSIKKKYKFFFFIILNFIYFNAIQTAVFYQNMFLDLEVSCDQKIKKIQLRKNWLLTSGLKLLVGWSVGLWNN